MPQRVASRVLMGARPRRFTGQVDLCCPGLRAAVVELRDSRAIMLLE